jgi:hypothetical protein
MMGSRGTRGGGEIDCLSHGYRRLVRCRMKAIRFFKRKFWKRQRRQARRDAGAQAEGCERDA